MNKCLFGVLLLALVWISEGSPLAEKVSSMERSARKARSPDGLDLNLDGHADDFGNWNVGGGLGYTRDGWRLGADGRYYSHGLWDVGGRLSYERENLGWYVSGRANSAGGYNFGTGLTYRFKKRSAEITPQQFNVTLRADPCYFSLYDIDRNGFITLFEFKKIFGPSDTAEEMFNTLDLTTGDGILERREFDAMSPKVITTCGSWSE